jgi:fructokinase
MRRLSAQPRPLDVLSFGEALVDFFPSETGVPLSECDVFFRHLGGAPANVAVGLARLGVRTGLMTLVGPDEFGEFVRQKLVKEGVDVEAVGRHGRAKTGVTFVSVAKDGARRFLFFRHPSADQMIGPENVDERLVARARVLHVGSSTLSREPARAATWKAIEAARAAGCLISTDPNWRPHLWDEPESARPVLERLLKLADMVKVSEDELEPLVGVEEVEAGARRIRALGPTLVVVTLGARGCYFDAPAGSGYVPGEVVPVVDTTGAGDGFVAGLWAVLLDGQGWDALNVELLGRACRFANHVGAQVVTALGATSALPRLTAEARRRK